MGVRHDISKNPVTSDTVLLSLNREVIPVTRAIRKALNAMAAPVETLEASASEGETANETILENAPAGIYRVSCSVKQSGLSDGVLTLSVGFDGYTMTLISETNPADLKAFAAGGTFQLDSDGDITVTLDNTSSDPCTASLYMVLEAYD